MYSVFIMGNAHHHVGQPDCPRAKKCRTDDNDVSANIPSASQQSPSSSWDCLPVVILDDIFQYLSFKDCVNASSTCYNWRQTLYHPRKWQKVNYVIEPDNLDKAKYFRMNTGHLVSHASVRFNSIEPSCVTEFMLLLKCFMCNNNLRSLSIEPSHNTIDVPDNFRQNVDEFPIYKIFVDIYSKHTLTNINLGCNEELFDYLPDLLAAVDEKKAEMVEALTLATVKEDPCNYPMQSMSPNQLSSFRLMQILSLDYDNLSDEMLDMLTNLDDFRRLVVHVHGIEEKHPGTSENAWARLRLRHPNCRLRLSFIHSTDEVKHMHTKVLRVNMPLSHLKVLFCEQMNLNVLVKLTMFRDTFESLMWVDNIYNDDHDVFFKPLEPVEDIQPQELVIVAWLCTNLSEIVFIGYKFYEEDWVGILKLRSDSLRRLEIAQSDIIASDYELHKVGQSVGKERTNDCLFHAQHEYTYLGTDWKPLPDASLHPAIVDPYGGDETDEYLLPILLADVK